MEFGAKCWSSGPWKGLPTYEETLFHITEGGRTNLVCTVLVRDPKGGHVCRSNLGGQIFRLKADLNDTTVEVTALNARVGHFRCPILSFDHASGLLQHEPRKAEDYMSLSETCSGIGGLGHGAKFAGWKECVQNEVQPKFHAHQEKYGPTQTVLGDICRLSTIMQMHQKDPTSATLGWGFSCQPFSKLGDGRQGADPRSATLPFGLFASYLLRKDVVVLECVAEAAGSPYVQRCLDYHLKVNKCVRTETVLELAHLWPSQRRRWWTVITREHMGKVHLPPLPVLQTPPTWYSLMPDYMTVNDHEMNQLRLSDREYQYFMNYGKGLEEQQIKKSSPLGTALHSWGNQCQACACECRGALSEERLQRDGLYGALITQETAAGSVIRHIAPRELALLVGYNKETGMHEDQRLLLAGLGQIASPIQACWIFCHVRNHLHDGQYGPVTKCDPRRELGNLVMQIFKLRDQWINGVSTCARYQVSPRRP